MLAQCSKSRFNDFRKSLSFRVTALWPLTIGSCSASMHGNTEQYDQNLWYDLLHWARVFVTICMWGCHTEQYGQRPFYPMLKFRLCRKIQLRHALKLCLSYTVCRRCKWHKQNKLRVHTIRDRGRVYHFEWLPTFGTKLLRGKNPLTWKGTKTPGVQSGCFLHPI